MSLVGLLTVGSTASSPSLHLRLLLGDQADQSFAHSAPHAAPSPNGDKLRPMYTRARVMDELEIHCPTRRMANRNRYPSHLLLPSEFARCGVCQTWNLRLMSAQVLIPSPPHA